MDIQFYQHKRLFLSPVYGLATIVGNQLAENTWIYFCVLYSVPLVYVFFMRVGCFFA
jgi:hypothetical protein